MALFSNLLLELRDAGGGGGYAAEADGPRLHALRFRGGAADRARRVSRRLARRGIRRRHALPGPPSRAAFDGGRDPPERPDGDLARLPLRAATAARTRLATDAARPRRRVRARRRLPSRDRRASHRPRGRARPRVPGVRDASLRRHRRRARARVGGTRRDGLVRQEHDAARHACRLVVLPRRARDRGGARARHPDGRALRTVYALPRRLPDRSAQGRARHGRAALHRLPHDRAPRPDPRAALRPRLGPWIFGCDVCQEVCPWNLPATAPRGADADGLFPFLPDLLQLDPSAFRRRFSDSSLARHASARPLAGTSPWCSATPAIPPPFPRSVTPSPTARRSCASTPREPSGPSAAPRPRTRSSIAPPARPIPPCVPRLAAAARSPTRAGDSRPR